MCKKPALLIAISGIVFVSWAQEPAAQQIAEDLLESAGEELTDDTDIQEILDDLDYFRQNPLNINSATSDELSRLHVLSELQIAKLIAYRQKTGILYSIFEMASIEDFTPDVVEKLESFICFGLPEKYSGTKKSSGDLFLRTGRTFSTENQSGMPAEGSPERYYLRMKGAGTRMNYGLVAEKDPGEAFFSQSNRHGFDYTSAFVNFGAGPTGSRVYAGDFQVRFGQGLVASQGFSMGKSAETTQVFKSNEGIRSYSSTDENQFFRGMAAQLNFRKWTVYPFVALNRLDAHVDTLDDQTEFGAFQTSGYHSKGSELTGENALTQAAGGGHVTYAYNRWSFGFTAVYTHFNAALNRSDEPYNQFLPEGKENLSAGLNWKGSVKNIFFFGETALGKNSGRAILTGVLLKPAPNAECAVVYRNINKTYFSFFSNGFTESSRVNDEQALYLGVKMYPAPRWMLRAYADFFKHKWIKYLSSAPSSGTEFFAQVSFQPDRETNLLLRFFQEDKEQRFSSGSLKYNDQQLINRIRFHATREINEQLSVKSRLEFSFYRKQSSEKGFLIYQDLVFKPPEKRYAMNGRLAYFRTDGYYSRLYAYENDLLYSFSVPALFGHGVRSYFNFQYRIRNRFTLWLKLALSHQLARDDGEQHMDASSKSEFKLQFRYQF